MTTDPLLRYLDARRVRYHIRQHQMAIPAAQAARAAHVPVKTFAKGVLVKVLDRPPGRLLLVVIPAHARVDLEALREHIGFRVEIAAEHELRRAFPAYELGAAPPIGELALQRLPTFVDSELANAETIAFRAGTRTCVVDMPWSEFSRVAAPKVMRCALPR